MSVAGTWEADELAAGSTARVRFTSGASYEGGVQDGLYHGEGKYTWADGSCESTAPHPSTRVCSNADTDTCDALCGMYRRRVSRRMVSFQMPWPRALLRQARDRLRGAVLSEHRARAALGWNYILECRLGRQTWGKCRGRCCLWPTPSPPTPWSPRW